jgi:hypothetical protein
MHVRLYYELSYCPYMVAQKEMFTTKRIKGSSELRH